MPTTTLPESASPPGTSTPSPAHLPSSTTFSTLNREPTPTGLQQYAATLGIRPMTSSWQRPHECTWSYRVDGKLPSDNTAWLDYQPIEGATTLSCYPEGMFSGRRTGIFSPGICPSGWATAAVTARAAEATDTSFEQTTTAICCSSNYTFDGSKCLRTHSTLKAVPITYNRTASTYEAVPSATTTLYGAFAAVYTIQVLLQDADKKRLGLEDTDMLNDQSRRAEGRLQSTRLGIGFGAAVLAILLILAVYLCIRCCRGKKAPSQADSFSMEISGVQYELREAYGPKPISRRSTGESDVLHAEGNRHVVTSRSERGDLEAQGDASGRYEGRKGY